MFVNVRVKLLPHADKEFIPHYATEHAAGLDLRAAIHAQNPVPLLPGERVLVPSGIAIELPAGYEAQIRPRSGLAIKHGIGLLNSPGTIDADYRGEIKVIMQNFGQEVFTIERGMRIAQMVIARYERIAWKLVDELGETDRGDGGFGSSGLN